MLLWRTDFGLFLFAVVIDRLAVTGIEAGCPRNHSFEAVNDKCPKASYSAVAKFLKQKLNGNYDKNVRPNDTVKAVLGGHPWGIVKCPLYTGDPVKVLVEFKVMAFGKINEEEMDYTIDIFFRQWWQDERLAHHYNKVFTMASDLTDHYWTPDTYFRNVKSSKFHRVTRDNMRVLIEPNGYIYFSTRITLTASCVMDLSLFPMDTQTCELIIESYAYTIEDVVYSWRQNDPRKSIEIFAYDMAQFDLTNVHVWKLASTNSKGSFDSLRANFTLRRRTTFFIIQHYIPSAFMALLASLSFWIDRRAVPARISLCITCILSTMVLSNSINSSLPQISYLKAVDYYLVSGLTFIAACLVEYMCVLNIENKTYRPIKNAHGTQAVNLRAIPLTEVMDDKCHTAGYREGVNGLEKPKRAGDVHEGRVVLQAADTSPDALSGDYLDRVRPPHFIDSYARKVFPLLYGLFNIVYWSYFLPQHQNGAEKLGVHPK